MWSVTEPNAGTAHLGSNSPLESLKEPFVRIQSHFLSVSFPAVAVFLKFRSSVTLHRVKNYTSFLRWHDFPADLTDLLVQCFLPSSPAGGLGTPLFSIQRLKYAPQRVKVGRSVEPKGHPPSPLLSLLLLPPIDRSIHDSTFRPFSHPYESNTRILKF